MSSASDPIAAAIAENVAAVLARREAAAARAGRHPREVRLLAVTKAIPAERVAAGAAAGLVAFGENYVQEALDKQARVRKLLGEAADALSWHFIGSLQRNKVRHAVPVFEMIHSVDSVPLATEIDRRAGGLGVTRRILLEVNVGGEPSKTGFTPEATLDAARAIDRLPNLRLSGLMTVPPPAEDPEASRPHFRALRELRDEIRKHGLANEIFRELSMGMTADFEVAIEEGATWIRIGTAIFGPRPARPGKPPASGGPRRSDPGR